MLGMLIQSVLVLSVQRKLQSFRREVCWVSSPEGSVPKTFLSPVATRRNARLRSRVQSLKRRFVSSRVRTGVKKTGQVGKQKENELTAAGLLKDDQQRKAAHNVTLQMSDFDSHDDIDDIFASVGL